MALVDYSDSDASDTEQLSTAKPTTAKPSFQKVVDRSNPGKIRVSLPQATAKEDRPSDEPPAKRTKLGGGAFSGFNSFLPAPKRTNVTNTTTTGGTTKQVGLGAGVNLKTGSAPGFSREPEPEREYTETEDGGSAFEGSGLNLPAPKGADNLDQKPAGEVKLVGKPLMFKPLFVSRKPTKKKKQSVTPNSITTSTAAPVTPDSKAEKPAQRPKVSLFSMSTESETLPLPSSTGEYQPIIYEPIENREASDEPEDNSFEIEPSYENYTPNTTRTAPPAVPTPPVSQSLDDIAGDLNLTESQKRQLFGRQKGGRMQSATKVINFNTDQEYLHNEELRAAGEQVMHNPVRSIAPGKHSLKQLVNAAQTQKDALEESFAKGKSNRAEASSRYGW
ncbi:uncharacterized protein LY89DRAFT_702524 [Mollisia scopiformis]|uniref:Mitotic checkpoint regulator, MAD2B-interacting-domain-containing protein n=1 Tax=Mollisia scopiformis TaxID=149040 RepID=A0A132B3W0_MOLSC|nr:uncharacterized protein LY89DRAFT_702524 [Mollisia scopiformis]KUJ07095.1 hypothetical protein LY89DRAFT_702524 [Mollisia scopiformis]